MKLNGKFLGVRGCQTKNLPWGSMDTAVFSVTTRHWNKNACIEIVMESY